MNEDYHNARSVSCGPSHEIARLAWTELASSSFGLNSQYCPRTFMFSDWSGEHQGAVYQTISILICDGESLAQWLAHAGQRRSAGRTMSYKTLNNDVLRRLDLIPFLAAAGQLRGVLINVAFHSGLGSVFAPPTEAKLAAAYERQREHFPPHIFEKFLRNIDLAGYLTGLLVSADSEFFYILDEDACVETPERRDVFSHAFRRVVSQVTAKPPRRIGISTIARCGIKDDAEAACALADLSAGAFAEALGQILPEGPCSAPRVVQQLPEFSRPKADYILRWLRNRSGSLCKISFVIGVALSGRLTVSRFESFDDPTPTILLPPGYHEGRMRRNS